MELAAGFLLGFLGSFHCVAMCGPIAVSLPGSNKTRFDFLLGKLVYNFGRITLYSILGFIFGFFGERIFMSELQQIFSITVGLIILLLLLKSLLKRKTSQKLYLPTSKNNSFALIEKSLRFFTRKIQNFIIRNPIVNAIIPCGFIYLA